MKREKKESVTHLSSLLLPAKGEGALKGYPAAPHQLQSSFGAELKPLEGSPFSGFYLVPLISVYEREHANNSLFSNAFFSAFVQTFYNQSQERTSSFDSINKVYDCLLKV